MRKVLEVFPVLGRTRMVVYRHGTGYGSCLGISCAWHGCDELLPKDPSGLIAGPTYAIAAAALAAAARDRDEYAAWKGSILEPACEAARKYIHAIGGLEWHLRSKSLLAEYYRTAFADFRATLCRIAELGVLVRPDGPPDVWRIYLPTPTLEAVDHVRVGSRSIGLGTMLFHARDFILIPCVAAAARSCHEFLLFLDEAERAAQKEAAASILQSSVGAGQFYAFCAAGARAALRVLDSIDDILLG